MGQNTEPFVRIVFRAKNNRLISEREKRQMTQKQFAALCGVNISVIQFTETLRRVSEINMNKIADALDLEVAELFAEWLKLYGNIVNTGRRFFLLDDIVAQKALEMTIPTPSYFLEESFERDLQAVLSNLSERERFVIVHRYGIGGQVAESYTEIGELLGLSGTRISQIHEHAICCLRHASRSKILRQYLGESVGA